MEEEIVIIVDNNKTENTDDDGNNWEKHLNRPLDGLLNPFIFLLETYKYFIL